MPGDQGGCQASGGGQGWGFEGGGGSAQARRVHSNAASIPFARARAPPRRSLAPPRESVHTLRNKPRSLFSVKPSLLAASLPSQVIPAPSRRSLLAARLPLAHVPRRRLLPPISRSSSGRYPQRHPHHLRTHHAFSLPGAQPSPWRSLCLIFPASSSAASRSTALAVVSSTLRTARPRTLRVPSSVRTLLGLPLGLPCLPLLSFHAHAPPLSPLPPSPTPHRKRPVHPPSRAPALVPRSSFRVLSHLLASRLARRASSCSPLTPLPSFLLLPTAPRRSRPPYFRPPSSSLPRLAASQAGAHTKFSPRRAEVTSASLPSTIFLVPPSRRRRPRAARALWRRPTCSPSARSFSPRRRR